MIFKEAIQLIRNFNLDVKILILTVFDTNEKVFDALCAGASGYLLKKHLRRKLLKP